MPENASSKLTGYAGDYMTQAVERLQWVQAHQSAQIAAAGAAVAKAVAAGGLWYVMGTGHSHMLAEEVFYRAGGLVPVVPMLDSILMLHESATQSTAAERLPGLARIILDARQVTDQDVLLIASNSGRNAVPVEMARLAKERGIFTIAITSLAHSGTVESRDPSGLRLFEVADLVIDNGAPYGDALVAVGREDKKMGPCSTIVGACIMNAIAIEATARLQLQGIDVPTLVSANSAGADHTAAALEPLRRRVRHV
ncbi:MAG TPA: SIS domain-containing protein [Firmicutes bacterium]|nr:SIS domain-containing protein [Bacillota bacterium]